VNKSEVEREFVAMVVVDTKYTGFEARKKGDRSMNTAGFV